MESNDGMSEAERQRLGRLGLVVGLTGLFALVGLGLINRQVEADKGTPSIQAPSASASASASKPSPVVRSP